MFRFPAPNGCSPYHYALIKENNVFVDNFSCASQPHQLVVIARGNKSSVAEYIELFTKQLFAILDQILGHIAKSNFFKIVLITYTSFPGVMSCDTRQIQISD